MIDGEKHKQTRYEDKDAERTYVNEMETIYYVNCIECMIVLGIVLILYNSLKILTHICFRSLLNVKMYKLGEMPLLHVHYSLY